MNLMTLMQGKGTYRAAYTLVFSGVYVMAVQAGEALTPGVDPVFLIAAMLKGDGFKLFMAGWALWAIRRAMAKGGAEEPPMTDEEKAEEAAKLKATLVDVERKLQSMKGNQQ
jgi:hypothetical protein